MFGQSQYFENIIRIARLLGYSSQGITPSTAMFRITNASSMGKQGVSIPPFASVSTNDGKFYSYSPYRWQSLNIPRNIDEGGSFDVLLHNGIWRKYPVTLTPNGSDFETFILSQIGSEMD